MFYTFICDEDGCEFLTYSEDKEKYKCCPHCDSKNLIIKENNYSYTDFINGFKEFVEIRQIDSPTGISFKLNMIKS